MMMFMFGELNLNYYKMIIMNVKYCVKKDEINNIKPIIDLININSDMTNVFFVESLGNNSLNIKIDVTLKPKFKVKNLSPILETSAEIISFSKSLK